jgi:ligand-binding sensor domain-containing protein/DNA-binding CsgD family transcriptional regulator
MITGRAGRAISLVLLLLAVLPAGLPGAFDDLRFQNLSVEDGLSQNTVNCMLRDRNGFMWFGTEEGLNRYNGYDFKVYRYCRHHSDCLGHDRVTCLVEDKDGSFWIGTNGGGLDHFDAAREHFDHFRSRSGDERSLSNDSIWAILPDGDGIFWIGTQNGLNRFDSRRGIFRRYLYAPERSDLNSRNTIYALQKDEAGMIWIGTAGGLVRFDPGRGEFANFQVVGTDPDASRHDEINALFDDGQGTLWLGSEAGLGTFTKASRAFTFKAEGSQPLPRLYHGRILNMFHAEDGHFWVACEAGLYVFPSLDLLAIYFRAGALPQRLLKDKFVFSSYQDPAGILWAGSINGIYKYDLRVRQFSQYGSELGGKESKGSFFWVTAVSQDRRGRLWLGTYKKGLFGFIPGLEGKKITLALPGDDPQGRETIITALYVDRDQVLWIGTDRGLVVYDIETARFLGHYRAGTAPGSLSHDGISAMLQDRSGRLWVGTNNGLNLFDPQRRTFTVYRHEASLPQVIGRDFITAFCQDREGVIWVGSLGDGLSRFDPASGGFLPGYRHRDGDLSSLGSDTIYCLLEDSRGRLWVGTNSGGLNLLDRTSGKFTNFSCEDGLPNNSILGMLEDRQGDLWLSTSRGICKFSPEGQVPWNFTYRDGLQGNEFMPRSYFHGAAGEMFFGGARGVTGFFPEEIKLNPHVPPVAITAVSVFNRNLNLGGDIGRLKMLELGPKDTVVSIAFAALSYSDPQRNRYAYKIDGLNKDWIQIGNRHEITLSNLLPGSYVFRVKGSNNHGVWNEQGATLAFIMRPPWWQTWWFRLPVFLSLLLAFVQWNRSRARRMAARIRTEASMEKFFEKYQISQREKEIIHLLLKGKSNKEIEDALFIAMGTVKNHVYSIYQKIGVRNRAQLLTLFKNLQVK